MLGTFLPQTAEDYSVSIYIDPKADNQYASLLGEVKWIFEASGNSSGDISDVSTTKPATTEQTEHSTEPSSTTEVITQEHTTSENTQPATTSALSTTAVTSTETTSQSNGPYNSESKVPNTGDRFPTVVLIVIAVCSGVALIVFAIKRKKDKDIDVHTDIEIK